MSVRIRYIVNDIPAAVTFYTDKLGFRIDAQSGPYFAALSRGGVQLLLSPVKGPGGASQAMPNGERPAPGGWNRLVLDTPDLEADVDRLRKGGVHFRNEIIVGLGGNQILLDDMSEAAPLEDRYGFSAAGVRTQPIDSYAHQEEGAP